MLIFVTLTNILLITSLISLLSISLTNVSSLRGIIFANTRLVGTTPHGDCKTYPVNRC